MRRIKFRAWNTLTKCMSVQGVGISYADNTIIVSVDGGSHIVMQYTGLKDKNGVEIYEGDVVVEDGCRAKVEWSSDWAGWSLTYAPNALDLISGRSRTHDDEWNVEVIGNSYESPELLRDAA